MILPAVLVSTCAVWQVIISLELSVFNMFHVALAHRRRLLSRIDAFDVHDLMCTSHSNHVNRIIKNTARAVVITYNFPNVSLPSGQ